MRLGPGESPYDAATELLEAAIAERFGFNVGRFDSPALKVADLWALRIEVDVLISPLPGSWRWPEGIPLGGRCPDHVAFAGGLDWRAAKDLLIQRLQRYPDVLGNS